jgi:hypothetical protein
MRALDTGISRKIKGAVRFMLTIAALLLNAASCTSPGADEVATEQAAEALAKQDSLENELLETLSEINSNLELIREKQGLIRIGAPENISKKQQILENISLINSLIEENRKKSDRLTIQLRKLGKEKNALARVADQARERIRRQEEEIENLKDLLEKESFKVAELNQRVQTLESDNEAISGERSALSEGNTQLDREINTAWFTYGTASQLKEKQVVEKKGGVLGIGRKEALTDIFHRNKAVFTAIDIRETSQIPLHGKRPRLLTDHPKGSYELNETEGEYSQLNIKEASDFWSRSRFLVIEVH